MEVRLATHAGFCFGVKRAVEQVYEQIETGKTILEIGTDYTDSYYPMAICHYYPENMAINQQQSNVTNTSDNNYTNDWVITSTGMSGDYQIDENIAYIYI